ncbi:MAG: HEAT repeat domain-containing protein [Gemmatimonadota bacterium]
MTDSTEVTQVDPVDAPPALSTADVENLVSTIGKTLRAYNMYQANNPVFQRFHRVLRETLEETWDKTGEVNLAVTEEGFHYRGHTMQVGSGRDRLAFAFYKDGIRHLTLLPGFEDEVDTFLRSVNRAMRRDADADDLITVLWEEDFASLQYEYVDLLAEGLTIPEEARKEPALIEGGFASEIPEAAEGDAASEGLSSGSLTMSLSQEDFDETLYFLDQAEMAALQTEVEIEMERDLRQDVLNALFDRLEEPDPARQTEILDILDQLLPLFLSRGDMAKAARVLDELDRMQAKGAIDPGLRERVEQVFDRLSAPEVLEQFVQAVEDGAVAPDSEDVNLFFSRLHARALPILIRYAEMSDSEAVRNRLGAALDGLAGRYPPEVTGLLGSDERELGAGAARVAGRVGLAQAVPGLQETLGHEDPGVRLAAVEALVAIRLTPALNALGSALGDEDREVRIAAAKALGAVRFASARPALEKVIEGRRIRDADLTEKMAFFGAYGALGGQAAVERLSEILNARGFLGRRNPTELRACAALGLGRASTPAARSVLEKAVHDEDPIVRNAVMRALQGGARQP